MKSNEEKEKFLIELAKDGIIASACRKTGISRTTYYRWINNDSSFKKRLDEAMEMGKANMCDLANFSLIQLVKEKNLAAIKWLQTHSDPQYKPKPKRVFIEHENSKFKKEKERFELEMKIERGKLFAEQKKLLDTIINQDDDDDEPKNPKLPG